MNLQEQTYRIKSIMRVINESNEIQKILDNRESIINSWINYYGSEERAKYEFGDYLSDFNYKYENGGKLYRCIFVNSPDEVNTDELGDHWTLDSSYIHDFIDSLWRHYGQDKEMCIVVELLTEPNNITPASDVRGNPEEKEVNIIDNSKTKISKLYQYQGKRLIEI